MKLLGLLLCFCVVVIPIEGISDLSKLLEYKEGDRYFFTSDSSGNLKLVDLTLTNPEWKFDPLKDVTFRLYTRKNRDNYQLVTLANDETLLNSNFDPSKPTKMFVHGWTGNGGDGGSMTTKNAFLDAFDANVFIIDWSIGAAALYNTACTYVPSVGVMMGKMVDWLLGFGSEINSFHLTGYSLGGHVVGNAGRSVVTGKVPYITSLDPAFPLWGESSERIRPSDARYVEVIHTNMNNLGLKTPVGHNDFYPNGGMTMPGCSIVDMNCSHAKAYQYFSASLDHTKFMANQCASVDEITSNTCSNISRLHMGGGSPKEARGLFYLTTNAEYPYYQE